VTRKGGLGRNLDSLIPSARNLTPEKLEERGLDLIPLNLISTNPKQPRTYFDPIALNELVESIKEVGILQPPVVRRVTGGRYELIMGERRFRAAKAAGFTEIPVVIRETSDSELLREALIENIHRSQLNPLEEAAAYNQLLEDLSLTHDELASRLGKSRAVITNTLRLLGLPLSVQKKLIAGDISAGHARALLALSSEIEMEKLAVRIVNESLSVRSVEEIVALTSGKPVKKKVSVKSSPNPAFLEIAEKLGDALNTRVTIENKKIAIDFADGPDLQRIVKIITESN
jgi:ParB family transcriptional regulator, chromosome partitioning protein